MIWKNNLCFLKKKQKNEKKIKKVLFEDICKDAGYEWDDREYMKTIKKHDPYSCDRRIMCTLAIFAMLIFIMCQKTAAPITLEEIKNKHANTLNKKQLTPKEILQEAKKWKGFYFPASNQKEEWGEQVHLDEAAEKSYSAGYVNFVKNAGEFDPNVKRDVCVVGAGMSGTVIAERYANVLKKKVLVIDRRPHIAGTCFDFNEPKSDLLINRYGAHVLHTSHPMVWKYLNMHKNAPKWQTWKGNIAVIADDDVRARYPVSEHWVKAFATQSSNEYLNNKGFKDYLKTNRIPCKSGIGCINEAEFIRSQVGEELYEEFYSPYFVKAFGTDPNTVPPGTVNLNTHSILENKRPFREKHIVIPEKGYTRWFAALLDNPNIETVVGVDFLDYKKELLNNCEKIIYTGPIDSYFTKKELNKAGLSSEKDRLQYRGFRFHAQTDKFKNIQNMEKAEKFKEAIMESPDWETEYLRKIDYKLMDQDNNKNHLTTILIKEIPTKLEDSENKEPFWAIPTKKNLELFHKYEALAEKEKKTEFIGLAKYRNFNLEETIENALLRFHKISGHPKIPDMPGFFEVKDIQWLHIPKTGTSFLYNMIAYKCDKRIKEAENPKEELEYIYNRVSHSFPAPPCVGRGMYHKHHPLNPGMFGFENNTESRFDVVTMMREPIRRIASGYVHSFHDCQKFEKRKGYKGPRPRQICGWLEKKPTAEQLKIAKSTILSYANCVKGCQTYMLNGKACAFKFANKMSDEKKRQISENALKKVNDLAFVGLTDSWEQSLCLFQKHFPRPSGDSYDFDQLKINTRPSNQFKCLDKVMDILRESNFTDDMDGPLFEQVTKNFYQHLGSCAHSFTETGGQN